MGRYSFEPLGKHNRAAFSCGEEALDRYLHERAGQDQRRNVTNCFVLCDRVNQAIVGYYTLSAATVIPTDLPESLAKKLPRYPNLPVFLVGRLAVDQRYHRQGFGERLLVDALRRARDATSQVAAIGVIVEAKNEDVATFYERYGFVRLTNSPLRLLLPMGSIPQA